MGLPDQPISLTPPQIAELHRQLTKMRHDINNHLSLVTASLELVRYRPEKSERMLATVAEQPPRIAEALLRFSAEFERALGITAP
ncbi:MAG TPA: hypothetical protein PLV05_00600 [Verrucomicrobiota bacterium]|jgi:hypothetical protein|nr:hypothetical protein [Verrucomicrobiota bacterium]OQC23630.1 MAG: hypothetical protein BWX68_02695 [Verrucomicrobia bacterium ADurb.Bin063]HRR63251.1 hypothetical protein [Candidatus Paceibacterota bacterium]MBP8014218.1 hypothetical protein [Verrucomicrobiota bacterium]MDI9371787.1 hypothetical protein [Verrucomicrobiota bacterium]